MIMKALPINAYGIHVKCWWEKKSRHWTLLSVKMKELNMISISSSEKKGTKKEIINITADNKVENRKTINLPNE